MRIGVDTACWANPRGYGRFTRELLTAMVAVAPDDDFVCFDAEGSTAVTDLAAHNVQHVAVRQSVLPTQAAAADGYRSPRDLLRFTRAVWRNPVDVFFSPSVYTYFPLPPRCPAVVTVHDTIAERFPELTLPSRRARAFWKLKVQLGIHQANLVLTVSEFSAREISEVLGVPSERLRIAPEAPASAYQPASAGQVAAARERAVLPASARWFTYVGGFNPHKNVDVTVRAHAALVNEELRRGVEPPYLVLVGRRTGDVFHGARGRIEQTIAECGTAKWVRWTGFVPDDELSHLLTGTLGLLLPSEIEGFGLPAVEAAACGAPVIATTASPLPELLAGGGLFVKPRDVQGLLTGMRVLLDDGARNTLGSRARQRATALTWRASAHAALSALREVGEDRVRVSAAPAVA